MSYRNEFNNYLTSSNQQNNQATHNNISQNNLPSNLNNSKLNVLTNTNLSNFNNTGNQFQFLGNNNQTNNLDFLNSPNNLNLLLNNNSNSNIHNVSAYSNNSNSQEMNSTDINSKYNQYRRNLNMSKGFNLNAANNINANFNNANNNLNNFNEPAVLDQNFLQNHLITTVLPDNDKEYEQYDKQKFIHLKKLYDERIKSLYNQIRVICKKFETDEILGAMKNDFSPNNQEFALQRIKEILDENFICEKETLILAFQEEISELNSQINYLNKNLNEKITNSNFEMQDCLTKIKNYESLLEESFQKNQNFQSEIINQKNQIALMQTNFDHELKKLSDEYMQRSSKLNNDLQKIKADNISLQDYLAIFESKYKEINNENEENKLEMDRLQKVISVLEIDLNVNEGKLKEKQAKIDALTQENTNIQTHYFEINLKYKKFMDENKNLESLVEHFEKERKEILDKYNSFNEDMHKSHNEKFENAEKKYKEKYGNLKKKIIELKSIISNLEEELNLEKNSALDTKINYSKIITKMQEDMKLIKSEWEKKCKEQTMDYEKVISDLEAKHAVELNTVKQDLLAELENRNKEIGKFRQSAELLKNFEKEFIRISNHEEILNETLNEMKKKFNQELLLKEEELENELRKRLAKLDGDKKGEYEFLTDNTRKNLKNLEKQNEELKAVNLDIQNKLVTEKANNEILNANNLNQQKTIRQFKMEIDEKDNHLKILNEKFSKTEEFNNNNNQVNRNLQNNIDSLTQKLSNIERERDEIYNELKNKEILKKEESTKFEREIQIIRESKSEKYEKEYESHLKAKSKLKEYETIIEQLQNDNNFLLNKNADLDKNYSMLDNAYETLTQKNKEQSEFVENLEKHKNEISKKLKNLEFEHNNNNDLVVKLLKTKLNGVRSEIKSIKVYYNNEIKNIHKEHSKILESLFDKIKIFSVGFEKDKSLVVKSTRDFLEKELKSKLSEKEKEAQSDIFKITQKYENTLSEQMKQMEKKEKENKILHEQIYENHLKLKEMNFKQVEFEQENKTLNNQINKLRLEIENLNESLDKTQKEKLHLNKQKSEIDDINDSTKRESVKKIQSNLSNLLLVITKIKKKYNQEIYKISTDLEKLQNSYETDKKTLLSNIHRLENELFEEKENEMKLLKDLERKEIEFVSINKDIERIKDVYENKISLLNTKLNSDEDTLNEMKLEIKNRNENIKELTNNVQESKNKMKNMKTQMEMKNDEIINIKKEYEKLINAKDKKINELKMIINQSFYSLNSGLNNIKIANKLDDEVKVLMKRAKVDDSEK